MPLDLSRIRALCFDVDGTLSDTDDLWVQQVERIIHPLRILFPGRQVHPFARWAVMGIETPGNLVYYLLDRFRLDQQVARLYNVMARRQRSRPRSYLLIPQVQETLHQLHAHFPMAVVSAGDRFSTAAFLEHFEFTPLFRAIATSQTCEYTKPFPHPILWAAGQMGVPPQECLMIGDTTVDIRAGKAAGAQTVGVLCGFGTRDELLRAGADLVLPATSDLISILLPQVPASSPETAPADLHGEAAAPAGSNLFLPHQGSTA
jgi:N-acetyl-D-muramate 6-phosphate phosphatase